MSVAAQWVHGVKVCIIPRPENNYKPLALQKRSLSAVSGFLITAKLLTLALGATLPATAELATITQARIIQLTNTERTNAGLPALTVNQRLNAAAAKKAEDMLKHDYFAHVSPAGVTPWFWIAQQEYVYQVAGENLAIDFTEAEDVVKAWMESPSHKANIVHERYTETGVAVLTGEYQGHASTVVVHMFGTPTGGASEDNQPAVVDDVPEATPVPVTVTPTPELTTAPTATPTPELTTAPTATPTPEQTATPVTPPRTPRIASEAGGTKLQNDIQLNIDADPDSTVFILINNSLRAQVVVPPSGSVKETLSVATVPDGSVRVKAYAQDEEGLVSGTTEELILTKDTQGPALDETGISAVVSPATDRGIVAIVPPKSDFESLLLSVAEGEVLIGNDARYIVTTLPRDDAPLRLTALDELGNRGTVAQLALRPTFYTDAEAGFQNPSVRMSRITRRTAVGVGLIIAFLLLLAILIRIRVQHPHMIAHASMVLVLAAAILLF